MINKLTVTKVDSTYLCSLTSNTQRICPVAGLERMTTGSVAKRLTPLRHTIRPVNLYTLSIYSRPIDLYTLLIYTVMYLINTINVINKQCAVFHGKQPSLLLIYVNT